MCIRIEVVPVQPKSFQTAFESVMAFLSHRALEGYRSVRMDWDLENQRGWIIGTCTFMPEWLWTSTLARYLMYNGTGHVWQSSGGWSERDPFDGEFCRVSIDILLHERGEGQKRIKGEEF